MRQYKFTLEPYAGPRSRYTCPSCKEQHQFARYIDTETGEILNPEVGRCNNQIRCGYHKTPSQYFRDNPGINKPDKPYRIVPRSPRHIEIPSYIQEDIFRKSLTGYSRNNFVIYLVKIFGEDKAKELCKKFHIGTSSHWPGSTVFWQVDRAGKIRSGKIMLYDPETGKRIKNPFNHITWVHKVLKIQDFNLKQCFYGEQQLDSRPYDPVALVESEKTAIICSVLMPEFIWLPTGGLGNLNLNRVQILKGRQIYLFPDLKAYEKWCQKVNGILNADPQFSSVTSMIVSDLLEKNSSSGEREGGFDLADYLTRDSVKQSASDCPGSLVLKPGHSIETYTIDGENWSLEINEYDYPGIWDKEGNSSPSGDIQDLILKLKNKNK